MTCRLEAGDACPVSTDDAGTIMAEEWRGKAPRDRAPDSVYVSVWATCPSLELDQHIAMARNRERTVSIVKGAPALWAMGGTTNTPPPPPLHCGTSWKKAPAQSLIIAAANKSEDRTSSFHEGTVQRSPHGRKGLMVRLLVARPVAQLAAAGMRPYRCRRCAGRCAGRSLRKGDARGDAQAEDTHHCREGGGRRHPRSQRPSEGTRRARSKARPGDAKPQGTKPGRSANGVVFQDGILVQLSWSRGRKQPRNIEKPARDWSGLRSSTGRRSGSGKSWR